VHAGKFRGGLGRGIRQLGEGAFNTFGTKKGAREKGRGRGGKKEDQKSTRLWFGRNQFHKTAKESQISNGSMGKTASKIPKGKKTRKKKKKGKKG